MDRDDIPHLRKVGRYLFYAPCAFGFGVLASFVLLKLGMSKPVSIQAMGLISFVAFLSLRDIEKNAFKRAKAQGSTHD